MRGLPLAATVLLPALAFGAAPAVVATPESVVLGSGTVVQLRVRGDGGALRGFASVGTLEQDPQAGAEASFRFRPPDIRYPTTAVLLFWTGAAKASDVALVRVPLLGRTDLQVSTEPRATVNVQVQDRTFGPVVADGRGRAKVPIEVPPHVRTAKVLVDAGGQKSTRQAPIDVPETNPLAAAFSSESFAADEAGVLIIAHEGGKASAVAVKVNGGQASVKESGRELVLYSVGADKGREAVDATVTAGSWSVEVKSAVRKAGTPPPVTEPEANYWPFAAIGGFVSGGANLGPTVVVGAGKTLMPALTLELETGFRTAGLSSEISGLGTVDSRLWGIPLQLGARLRLIRIDTAAVDVRAGLGVQLFSHSVRSDFQRPFSEGGLRPDGFIAISASMRTGAFEPFAELRGQWGLVPASSVDARLGGLQLCAGARYAWR